MTPLQWDTNNDSERFLQVTKAAIIFPKMLSKPIRTALYILCFFCFVTEVDVYAMASTPQITNTPAGTLFNSSNDASTALFKPSYNHVKGLYAHLLKNYDKRIRPRIFMTDTVNVSVSFVLTGIQNFDTASQILVVWGYFMMDWMDELIVWNPLLYNGIQEMKFPISQIWTPAMFVISSFDGVSEIKNSADQVTIGANGYVLWTPKGTYKVYCDVNIKFYPFDKQTCEILVYVSDAFASEVDLVEPNTTINTDYFKKSSAWKLVSLSSEKRVFSGIPMISIYVELDRRRDFIIYTIIAPLVLLSVLNVGVFIVPVDSGEKGSIAVTIFLSYGVFISTISDELPHNSLNISYILIYILLLLLLSVAAVLYSYVQSYIFSRYANDTVHLGILTARTNIQKVSPMAQPPNEYGNDDENNESFKSELDQNSQAVKYNRLTWNILMRKLDTYVFLFFFVIVFVATCVFFIGLSQSGENAFFGSS